MKIKLIAPHEERKDALSSPFRFQRVKVVMGGIHPTVLPEEALNHADAVVVGEAESVWPQLVYDTSAGQMQRIYNAGKMTDLKSLPKPARTLSPEAKYKGYNPIP